MRILLPSAFLALAFALQGGAVPVKEQAAQAPPPDAVISEELSEKNRVLILKDRETADSLFRLKVPPVRAEFERLVRDTVLFVEVRTRAEFQRHWRELESREGFREMRAQYAAADPDRSRISRVYLFDSSVVVYPGWIIVRRIPSR